MAAATLPTDDPTTDGLTSLLSGSSLTPERFLADYWERTMLHLPRDDPTTFGGLLRLEDMDALLCCAACPAAWAELLVFKGLVQVDTYATPHVAFASGASLIINHTDKVWRPANDLCAQLGRRFGHAYANLYLTPGDSQTAPPHSDDRDVFVLQLHGEKAWRVWSAEDARTQPLPFTDEMVGKGEGELLAEEPLGEPSLRCALQPGHLLYIPRGAPHVACTAGSASPSMHLTIAVPTADLSWSGFAMQAFAAATGHSRHASLRPPAAELPFRRALPLGPLPPLPPPPPPVATTSSAAAAGEAAAAPAAAAPPATTDVAAAVAEPTGAGGGAAAAAAGSAWSETFGRLHAELCAVSFAEARQVLGEKLERKAREQRRALELVARQMGARGAPAPLRPGTVLGKQLEVELLDGGRVVQTRPAAGSGVPVRHTFIPPAMLPVVEEFMALRCPATFTLAELQGPDPFLKACAVRQLMALRAVVMLAEEPAANEV